MVWRLCSGLGIECQLLWRFANRLVEYGLMAQIVENVGVIEQDVLRHSNRLENGDVAFLYVFIEYLIIFVSLAPINSKTESNSPQATPREIADVQGRMILGTSGHRLNIEACFQVPAAKLHAELTVDHLD